MLIFKTKWDCRSCLWLKTADVLWHVQFISDVTSSDVHCCWVLLYRLMFLSALEILDNFPQDRPIKTVERLGTLHWKGPRCRCLVPGGGSKTTQTFFFMNVLLDLWGGLKLISAWLLCLFLEGAQMLTQGLLPRNCGELPDLRGSNSSCPQRLPAKSHTVCACVESCYVTTSASFK